MSTGTANRAVSGTQSGPECMLKQAPAPGNVRHGRSARRSRSRVLGWQAPRRLRFREGSAASTQEREQAGAA